MMEDGAIEGDFVVTRFCSLSLIDKISIKNGLASIASSSSVYSSRG
jgi:hypothetical protein